MSLTPVGALIIVLNLLKIVFVLPIPGEKNGII